MIPFPQNNIPRVWSLANAVCEGTISEEELQELQALLDADPKAKEFYVDFLNINAEISWLVSAKQHSGMDITPRSPVDALATLPQQSPILGFLGGLTDFFGHHAPISLAMLLAVFAITLVAATYLMVARNHVPASAKRLFAARLTLAKDCRWSASTAPPTETEQLEVGRQLQLEKGIAQVTYFNGAEVLLEGPARFELDSPNSGFLVKGKLTAQAETKTSRQFAIATPDARFVDLGTEFGVMIDDKGRAAVAVFKGAVKAEAKLPGGRWSKPVPLREGEAVVCEAASFTRLVAQRSNYPSLRPLPPPPPLTPFQRWQAFSQDLQSRQDLLAYYDFQPDPNSTRKLTNRAPSAAALDGIVHNAKWAEGRFAGKSALEFKINDSGVQVDLPQDEMAEVTLVAWVNVIDLLKNEYSNQSGVLMSDGWTTPCETHWFMRNDGRMKLAMQNEQANIQGEGIGSGVGVLDTQKTDAWTTMNEHLGQWCMLATVYNTATKSITHYYNGVAAETLVLSEAPHARFGSATICGWCPTKDRTKPKCSLKGRMDELMIFSHALSPEEIKKIYEAGKP